MILGVGVWLCSANEIEVSPKMIKDWKDSSGKHPRRVLRGEGVEWGGAWVSSYAKI